MEYIRGKIMPILTIDSFRGAYVSEFEPGFQFPGESHEMWEMGCVLEGQAELTSGTEVYLCSEGEMVIHPPRIFHSIRTVGKKNAKLLTVSFFGGNGSKRIPKGKYILTENEKRMVEIACSQAEKHFDDSDSVAKAGLQIFKNTFESLCLSVYIRRGEAAQPKDEKDTNNFTKIAEYLNQNVDESLNVDDICLRFGMGKTALKGLFNRYTGGGIIKYYNNLRLLRAVELLEAGESMASISEKMNFSSQCYFSDFFRRHTGCPPSKYLNQNKKP